MAERERFPRRAGVAELVARRALTPRMIRVTLRSEAFGATWPIEQPGEIITLLFAAPGEVVVPPLDGWTFPPGVEQEWRNYTVRRHDPVTGEIEVDVVLHEPRGPACTWAEASADRRRRRLRRSTRRLRAARRRDVAAAVRRRDGAARDRRDPRAAPRGRARSSP